MQFESSLLVVRDLAASLAFYQDFLRQEVQEETEEGAVLECGVCLQTARSWAGLLGRPRSALPCGGGAAELCFVEEELDEFLEQLKIHPEVELLHPPLEQRWGQRTVRLYDPDRHIVKVTEPLRTVARRFQRQGMSGEAVALRMEIPLETARELLRQ